MQSWILWFVWSILGMYLVELRKEIAYAFWISHWVGTGLTFVCRKWLLIIPVQWTRLSALFYVSMACLVTFRIGRIHMGNKGNVSFNRSCCHMRLLGILWPSVKLTGWLVVQCPAWIYIKCKWALPNVKWFVDPFEKNCLWLRMYPKDLQQFWERESTTTWYQQHPILSETWQAM